MFNAGENRIFLGDGNDVVKAFAGDNLVVSGGGNDVIKTAGGDDNILQEMVMTNLLLLVVTTL